MVAKQHLPISHADESVSIALDDADLLDIDGSDDQTLAMSAKRMLRKLAAPVRNKRSAFARSSEPAAEDDCRLTLPIPMKALPPAPSTPSAPPPPAAGRKFAISPTISPVASMRKRNADSSYPPITVSAHRGPALSFVSERPSRAGWITASVIGVLILVGGSMRVAAPKHAAAASEPPAAVAVAVDAPVAEPDGDAQVVHFGDTQGVTIKTSADKADKKPATKPAAKSVAKAATKPAGTTKLSDGSLTLSDKSDSKTTAASAAPASSSSAQTALKKKLDREQLELADAQLRAASR